MKQATLSQMTAGLVAVMVGFTSSAAIVFQAASQAGANSQEISSWIFALCFGMAITCIGLSWYYRTPILTAWSTPGAAVLVASLSGISMPEAIGTFIFSALLITLAGFTGLFAKTIKYIPRSLASAMLAGILFQFGTNIFAAMQSKFFLVSMMFIIYLLGKRLFPRFVILSILILGIVIAHLEGLIHLNQFHLALSSPVFTMPKFSIPVLLSVGLPLFIVTMTSQNIPGLAALHASGYHPPISPLIGWSGLTNLLLAPFGAFALNLAALTAAICLSEEADQNPQQRYKAAVYAGVFYFLVGLFGATIAALFLALPKELVLALAGLALLSTISSSLKNAMENENEREPALITLLVSASGVSLLGISAAFWGLIAGILAFVFLNSYRKIYYPNAVRT